MIDETGRFNKLIERGEDMLGNAGLGRAYTSTLRVSPNGSGADGLSWRTAYPTIQGALDAASTDADDCTLILISPHATAYDINTTGDPTWSANVILQGSHRNWAKVVNTHNSSTSILKLTGKSAVFALNFNLGSSSNNGLIMTHGGCRVYSCQFVGEDLTGDATALWLDHATGGKHAKVIDCDFLGNGGAHLTALKIDQFGRSLFERLRIHNNLVGIHIVGANSVVNIFNLCDVGDNGTGIQIDSGVEQYFHDLILHHNTVNVTDVVGDHIWANIFGGFPIVAEPDDLVGVTVTTGAAGVYGADTELRAAVTSTKPFRIVGLIMEPGREEWFQIRLSDDSGSTFFDNTLFWGTKEKGVGAPSGTEFIFNKGTRISGSGRSETSTQTMKVWLKIQEI